MRGRCADGVLGETSARGDGYYWGMEYKVTDVDGNILTKTDPIHPEMARDDTGAGRLILAPNLYRVLGEPKTRIAHGMGFGYRIQHLVLHPDAKAAFKYYYRIVGLPMKWEEFEPVFFQDNPNAAARDLALMSTYGWKPQAVLGEKGVGFLRKGTKLYAVAELGVAEECVKKALWKI